MPRYVGLQNVPIVVYTSFTSFIYDEEQKQQHPSTDHQNTMKNMSFKIYERVIFPRMSSIASINFIFFQWSYKTKVLPIINAIFVHALTHGKDTMPSRRAIQSNKISHGKRGWREVNAEGLVTEYVMGILLPLLSSSSLGGGPQEEVLDVTCGTLNVAMVVFVC